MRLRNRRKVPGSGGRTFDTVPGRLGRNGRVQSSGYEGPHRPGLRAACRYSDEYPEYAYADYHPRLYQTKRRDQNALRLKLYTQGYAIPRPVYIPGNVYGKKSVWPTEMKCMLGRLFAGANTFTDTPDLLAI